MTAAAMETSAAMKAAAETCSAARGKCPGIAAVVESAEGAGMRAIRGADVVRRPESRASARDTVSIAEFPAVGDVRLIAVSQAVSMPIRSPVMPPPAEIAEEADPDPHSKHDPRPIEVEARSPNPTGVECNRITVDCPGIVFRHVNDLRICRFNDNRLSLGCDRFLLCGLQVSGLLRSLAHHLNRVEDILLPIYVCLAKR